jgi:hypothetical protein
MRLLSARSPARTTRAIALLLALCACDNNDTRIYTARPYQVDPGCLEEYLPLAVVYAKELDATCAAACFYFDGQLYVSTVCAPYPEAAEVSDPAEDTDCAAALVALEQDLSCDVEAPEEVPSEGEGEGEPDAGPLSPAPSDGGTSPDAG